MLSWASKNRGKMMTKHIDWRRAAVGAGLGLGALLAQAAGVDKYLDDARRYQQTGDHRAAVIQLKNALQQDADNRDARLLLAQSYIKLGDGAAAEKELKRVAELGASQNQVMPLLGQAYLLQRKFRPALDELKLDKTAPPQTQAALLGIQGTAQLALGEYAAAQEKFNAALKLDPNTEEALLGRARAALLQQHIDEAQREVDDLAKKLPRVAAAWLLKGEYHRARGEPERAIEAYQQAITLEPENINGHLGRAMMLIAERKYAEADKSIDAVLQRVPKHPLALYLKGLAAFQQNQMAAAKDALQQVVAVAPNYMPTYLLLGAIQYGEGEYESAAESLKRYVASVPDQVPARKLYAAVLLKLKQPARAIETLDVAAKKNPGHGQQLAMLGSAYMAKGDSAKGSDYLERAAKAAPDAAAIRSQLALGYLATGESDQAVSQLESAVDLGQGLVQADMLQEFTHLQRHEFAQALKAAQAMAKKAPKDPVPLNLMGAAYLGKKDKAAARKQFEQALKLDPGFSTAHGNLAALDEEDGNVAAAKRHYQAILDKDDKHAGAMVALARIAEQGGDQQETLKWLERARSKVPDETEPALLLSARSKLPVATEPALMLSDFYLRHGESLKAVDFSLDLSSRVPYNPSVL